MKNRQKYAKNSKKVHLTHKLIRKTGNMQVKMFFIIEHFGPKNLYQTKLNFGSEISKLVIFGGKPQIDRKFGFKKVQIPTSRVPYIKDRSFIQLIFVMSINYTHS